MVVGLGRRGSAARREDEEHAQEQGASVHQGGYSA
jgi:hypothetical protein